MENLKNKKLKFNLEIDAQIKLLEREIINKNIARRDAFRKAKQQWEDDGFAGPYNPNYKPAIQGYVDAAKLDHEEVKIKKKLKKVVEKVKEIIEEPPEPKPEPAPVLLPKQSEPKPMTIDDLEKELEVDIIEEQVIEAKKELIEKVEAHDIQVEEAREAADIAALKIETAVLSVADIKSNHQDWIDAYEEASGMKAIWRGRITNGFKEFITNDV